MGLEKRAKKEGRYIISRGTNEKDPSKCQPKIREFQANIQALRPKQV